MLTQLGAIHHPRIRHTTPRIGHRLLVADYRCTGKRPIYENIRDGHLLETYANDIKCLLD